MNAKCVNKECPEFGIVKTAENVALDRDIICGGCLDLCERTNDQSTEITDANATN